MPTPVILIILDGWGLNPRREANAVALARTPNFDRLWAAYPHTQLCTSGEDVGLPAGIMGNSEVGHMNLGAGRVVLQEVTRINAAIDDGRFFTNDVFVSVVERTKASGGTLHLIGLVSDGLVHSAERHYLALLELAKRRGFSGDRVCVHAILDGRDTPPKSALTFLSPLLKTMAGLGIGRIATVSGRYYAMDRDRRWERVQKAYDAYTCGDGLCAAAAEQAVHAAYERGETDEFVQPTVIVDDDRPVGPMRDGDGVIFFNYRADRGREMLRALTDAGFDGFTRRSFPKVSTGTMTQYDATLPVPFAFHPPEPLRHILGETISQRGKRQLRTAETEKYAHVTYFFNGGNETPFPGEDRILIPSPKWVATYDQIPEMSAPAVAWNVVHAIQSGGYDFILINFANPDMVGHTGVLQAAITAVEAVDWGLGGIIAAATEAGARALVTADHGNAEVMVDERTGEPHTAHTTNPVPFIIVDDRLKGARLRDGGRLADVAPTVLGLMELPKPEEMTGKDLRDFGL
ncbi:MAG: 2,3-bisphosphoglycerate-independent phosphoglycerate mutase [Candidatus Latescibacteria bacterium]|nr:2,3-bisphosphoglycerate-independent phosphoglycerate mutase [Candidatus Latescibacterota bacterium]